jgi:hypothetical protein
MSWLITPQIKSIDGLRWDDIPTSMKWLPSDTSTVMWFDASDSTSIEESSGSVSQWNDKSGNGRHASQATLANRPTLVANVYNGKAAIRSDGINDTLNITPFSVSAGIRSYAVVNPLEYTTLRRNASWVRMTDFTNFFTAFSGTSFPSRDWFDSFFSTTRPQITGTLIPPGSLLLAFLEQTGTAIKGRVFGIVNETSVSATFNGSPTARFQLIDVDGTAFLDLCEVIFLQSPSTTIQEKTEGYLAHKWGITSSLPSNHPYKTTPPTP